MPLTVKRVETAKPKDKTYRLSDGEGLFLEIPKKGSKRWRFRYQFEGKEKMLSPGTFPEVSLKKARDKRREMRSLVADGINPSELRKSEKVKSEGRDTFETVGREWFAKFSAGWSKGHAKSVIERLDKNVFPFIGGCSIAELNAQDMLKMVQRIEARKTIETARRVRQICSQIFRYAVTIGLADRDPAADIRAALPPASKTVKHHASITDPKQIGKLLKAIDAFEGTLAVHCALRFVPLVFVRPGELRNAEWSEIDFENKQWRIPQEKMKAGRPHIVPLSRQAMEVLQELHPLTGEGKYLFPSVRTSARPMSENTVNAALRRLGYSKEEMTGHGFRSMASTNLNEQGWNKDVIERQLAHVEGNSVRAAYNHADYMQERTKMMQAWADYLDQLREGGKVVLIFGQAQ